MKNLFSILALILFSSNFSAQVLLPIKRIDTNSNSDRVDVRWGLMDTCGNGVVYYFFDVMSRQNEGLIAAKEIDGDYGYIDVKGEDAISFIYQNARDFQNGFAAVKRKNRWTFIDRTGKEIIPHERNYTYIGQFHDGLATVRRRNKYGFIDTMGQVVINIKYSETSPFSQGRSVVRRRKNGKYGYIDDKGKKITRFKYDAAYSFSKDGFARVNIGSEGSLLFTDGGKWGFINRAGKVVIPIEYKKIQDFSEGLAPVKKYDKWGFIDTTGNIVIPFKYENVHVFNGNIAAVCLGGKWGGINKNGEIIAPFDYSEILTYWDKDNFRVRGLNGKIGYMNKHGEEIIPTIYDDGDMYFSNGYTGVKLGDEHFYIDLDGNEIKLQYE